MRVPDVAKLEAHVMFAIARLSERFAHRLLSKLFRRTSAFCEKRRLGFAFLVGFAFLAVPNRVWADRADCVLNCARKFVVGTPQYAECVERCPNVQVLYLLIEQSQPTLEPAFKGSFLPWLAVQGAWQIQEHLGEAPNNRTNLPSDIETYLSLDWGDGATKGFAELFCLTLLVDLVADPTADIVETTALQELARRLVSPETSFLDKSSTGARGILLAWASEILPPDEVEAVESAIERLNASAETEFARYFVFGEQSADSSPSASESEPVKPIGRGRVQKE